MNNSMINPSVVDLLEKVNDRYSLVILTSKRARQIIGGSKPKIDIYTKKALTIAINEVDQDAIEYENVGNNINK
ncbi:DNA-directed RNA polymerase subunit omega [Clostridium neonatale]|uniref:DNA-directed RNA polymerase subunit omega n=1 Tax=Clostridium neonatale TaxID=137838 RepID=UPI00291B534C|nr:DNA-directed RNA polymerase subunit omega (RNAP omega subunit) [Clostridium neonatale]CAI3595753.1 DNA-directed RNA polymerase subunit omega (RNAP omega subunit) [Clostridium neonatale]CAI3636741.1 DNA-directed RNA polymerase subunit omega (RNAP omega subunit) [Clostridium neonatale]CAI3681388.1 DNA-directed RNA polymerase subunit omega (RNAP omega subunit) [Clostridium neonatale]CAI3707762.1 DNA-directed RNA polymerase subunit omega (RNAP omega subunit) [Clostridium neonatale]